MSVQDITREKLIKFIELEGVSQKFITSRTGVVESNISRFKNNTLNLKYSDLERLEAYLKSKGY
jgi:predicted transcriptional regulator